MGKKNSRVIYMHSNERSDYIMATMVANFTFKGLGASVLREQVKNYLIKEFVARRNVFVDLVNPMYEKWNKEFYELYPGKNGYDLEYSKFIYEKHREPLRIANAKDMWLNEVELRSDITEYGDVYGYVKNLEVAIYLSLN